MRTRRLKKSEWRNGIWVTHAALLLGTLAIVVALASPAFSQSNVFNFLALIILVLSTLGIGMMVWRIELRSRRLRAFTFWYCLMANLILLVAMGVLFLRAQSLAPTHKAEIPIPATPDNF